MEIMNIDINYRLTEKNYLTINFTINLSLTTFLKLIYLSCVNECKKKIIYLIKERQFCQTIILE